jgi:hypothetical protein
MTQKESGASVFASLGRLVGIFTEREVFKIGNLLKPVTGQVICQFQPKGENGVTGHPAGRGNLQMKEQP